MPLALAGFTLQSFPLTGSTAPSSGLVTFLLMSLAHSQLPALPQMGAGNRDPKAPETQRTPQWEGVNPPVSPFTTRSGLTRLGRPILSWV
jgi:hypothetical protein